MSQKIATKLSSAMKDIDAVLKGGENKAQNYKYVRATDIAHEVRKALTKHGIAFTYQTNDERFWQAETRSGSTQFYCSLRVTGTFIDTESGETAESSVIAWGADTGDKAPYKATTGGLKYLLRTTFLIPDENDPENDNHEPEEVESSSVKQEKPQIKRKPKQPADFSDAEMIRMKIKETLDKFDPLTLDIFKSEMKRLEYPNLKAIPDDKLNDIYDYAKGL